MKKPLNTAETKEQIINMAQNITNDILKKQPGGTVKLVKQQGNLISYQLTFLPTDFSNFGIEMLKKYSQKFGRSRKIGRYIRQNRRLIIRKGIFLNDDLGYHMQMTGRTERLRSGKIDTGTIFFEDI